MPSETLLPTDPSGLDPARVEVIEREPDTLIWRWVGPDGSDLVTKLYRHRGLVSALRELVTRFRAEREFLRLASLFGLVRRMHEAGFCHQTLYPRNILVRADAPPEARYFVADVPRSWIFPASIVGTPMAWFDLLDLTRSLLELGIPPEAVPVEAYGAVEAPAGGRTLAMLRTAPDAGSRWSRLRRDAELRVRWTVARVRAWVGV